MKSLILLLALFSDVTLHGTGNDVADTASLQSAFDAAVVSKSCRDIELKGHFSINEPLRMSSYTKLEGGSIAYSYYAPVVSAPMLTVTGMGARVKDVDFYCNHRCRGLKFHTDVSTEIIRDVRVNDSIEIAVDLYDCWASNVYGLTIFGAHGLSLKTYRCNTMYFERTNIFDGFLLNHKDKEKNVELWKFAFENGNEAAKAEYGEDYVEHWPAEVAVEDRAVIVLGVEQDLTRFVNLRIEPVACGDLPAISCRSNNTTFEQLYFEGGYFSRLPDTAMMRIHNCANTTLNQTRVTSIMQSASLLLLTGTTSNTEVNGVYVYTPPYGLSRGIVRDMAAGKMSTTVRRQAGYLVSPVVRNK